MDNNILRTVKKMLGITAEDTHFDLDIMLHINSTFSVLTQLGAGPENGYAISSGEETWDEFLEESKLLNMVKSYMFLRVRSLFDPPTNASLFDAMEKMIKEYEWRIEVAVTEGKVSSNAS